MDKRPFFPIGLQSQFKEAANEDGCCHRHSQLSDIAPPSSDCFGTGCNSDACRRSGVLSPLLSLLFFAVDASITLGNIFPTDVASMEIDGNVL